MQASPSSYASGRSDVPLLGQTIGEALSGVAKRFAERDALVDVSQGRRWTYAQFDADVDRLARAMLAFGIARGDRVGIWAPNGPEWVLVQFATARIGAILVCINPAYGSSELAYVLDHSGVCLLFAVTGNRGADYRAMIQCVAQENTNLRRVVYIADPSWDECLKSSEDIAQSAVMQRAAQLRFDDAINIQYTSGTTGAPKGVTLTHHNILNNGYFVGELLAYTELDRVCVPVPFYHCFGMVMGNLGAISHGRGGGDPQCEFRSRENLAGGCGGALHVAVWRADDVHRGTRNGRIEIARPVLPTYWNHGRRALPDRRDARRDSKAAHARRRDQLWNDGDLAGLDDDARGRRSGAAYRNRRPRDAAPGGADRRRAHRAASTARNRW